MLKVKDGHTDLLGLLYERYKKILFAFFFQMTHNRSLSEDLVQTTFVRVLRYRQGYKGDGDFKAWLFRIARNANHDQFKKNKKLHAESLENWSERLGDSDDNYEATVIRTDEMKMLDLALGRLDQEKKEVLLLSKIEGMKYKEIGVILDCSEGTVKSKVFRALQALKQEFELVQSRM